MGTSAVRVVDEGVARRVLEVVDAGLVAGKGSATPGEMCVEAAVCYALGLPHSDRPTCVGSAVRAYKIGLNDSAWSSPAARAKGMRRAAVAQLGSDKLDQVEFARRIALETIRRVLPLALESAGMDESLVRACREAKDLAEADAAARAARAAAWSRAARAAWAAAWSAAAAEAAAEAAADAATDAAAAAASRTAWVADAADAASDQILMLAADMLVEVLVDMGSEGAEWLGLCE